MVALIRYFCKETYFKFPGTVYKDKSWKRVIQIFAFAYQFIQIKNREHEKMAQTKV